MITNELNLPQPFVDAATSNHRYKPNRYSVTEVLGGTCEAVLKRRHQGESDEDVSDRVWAILGTAAHKVMEASEATPTQMQEKWLCVSVGDYELSGIFDLYDDADGTVTDWKVTSVWQVMFGETEKWRKQLLAYCWMLRQKGYDAHRGQIVAILRDHSKRKAATEADYPDHPVQVFSWEFTEDNFTEAARWIADWFSEVQLQELLPDGELEPCDDDTRWHKPDKWAVMRRGQKRAVKLFDSESAATKHADWLMNQASNKGRMCYVEFREGEDTRCQSYCSVAQFCPYGRRFFQDSENSQPTSGETVL